MLFKIIIFSLSHHKYYIFYSIELKVISVWVLVWTCWIKTSFKFHIHFICIDAKWKTCFLALSSKKLQRNSDWWWNPAVVTAQECCPLHQVRFGIQSTSLLCLWKEAFSSRKQIWIILWYATRFKFLLVVAQYSFSSNSYKVFGTEESSCYLRNHYQVSH